MTPPSDDDLPRIHPRYFIVSKVRGNLSSFLMKAITENDLTYAEITTILAEEALRWAQLQVRDERRPTRKRARPARSGHGPGRKGGAAPGEDPGGS